MISTFVADSIIKVNFETISRIENNIISYHVIIKIDLKFWLSDDWMILNVDSKRLLIFDTNAPTIAQLEEHVTVDHGVAGSNPAGRITFWSLFFNLRDGTLNVAAFRKVDFLQNFFYWNTLPIVC
jgi:hypothetical protein